MDARHTPKCDIYKFNRLRNRCCRYTTFSIMMRIFYIDRQQHWECDRTMNIGTNAHSERTVSTKQPQLSSDRLDLRWQLDVQWHRRGIELVFKSLDCFTKRLFHKATDSQCDHFFFAATYVVVVWNFTRLITRLKGFFFFLPQNGGGALSSNVFTICAVYWSLDCRGYFGVSNVALVKFCGGIFLNVLIYSCVLMNLGGPWLWHGEVTECQATCSCCFAVIVVACNANMTVFGLNTYFNVKNCMNCLRVIHSSHPHIL